MDLVAPGREQGAGQRIVRADVQVVVGVVPRPDADRQHRAADEEGVLAAEVELVGVLEKDAALPLLGEQALDDARVLDPLPLPGARPAAAR